MNRKNLRKKGMRKPQAFRLLGDGANANALPATATAEQIAEARYKDWLAERGCDLCVAGKCTGRCDPN